MKYTLAFIPKIQNDVIAGYRWYESKTSGLGQRFLQTFYSRINDLVLNSFLFPNVYKKFRRCLLWKFPYVIYYTIQDSKITIWGVFHSSRDPRELHRLLENRNIIIE